MGFRFHRSIKIAPGLRWNFSKSGTSWSFGPRGFKINVGPRGVRRTVSLPGTGLSHISIISRARPANTDGALASVLALPPLPLIDPARFNLAPKPVLAMATRRYLGYGGLAMVIAALVLPTGLNGLAIVVGVVLLLVAAATASHATLERRATETCQAAARTELERRLAQFKQAAQVPVSAHAFRALLILQIDLGLTDDEIGQGTMELIHALLDQRELVDWIASGRSVPILIGHDAAISPDARCYFAETAVQDKPGDRDPIGTLYLTDARVLFVASDGILTTPWEHVLSVATEGRTLRVQRRDRQKPYAFCFAGLSDAMKAECLATHLLAIYQRTVDTPDVR